MSHQSTIPIGFHFRRYTLGANVENGIIVGTLAFNLTGNALANVLTGNTAVNVLTGGEGGDTYVLTRPREDERVRGIRL